MTYYCGISNWTCTGGGLNTYANVCDTSFSTIAEGTKAAYLGNGECNACSTTYDDTSCLSTESCDVTDIPSGYPTAIIRAFGDSVGVSLTQTVTGMTAGNIFVLEFWSGGDANSQYIKEGVFAVDVGFGNIFLRDPPTSPITGVGTRYVITFAAAASSLNLKFTSWGHCCTYCTELILDDVLLYEADGANNPCIVGINEMNENSVATVFPNPVSNLFTVTITPYPLKGEAANPPLGPEGEIILYDVTSRKLLQQKFTGSVTLNTENLTKGIYLYEVRGENGSIKQGKLVKE